MNTVVVQSYLGQGNSRETNFETHVKRNFKVNIFPKYTLQEPLGGPFSRWIHMEEKEISEAPERVVFDGVKLTGSGFENDDIGR